MRAAGPAAAAILPAGAAGLWTLSVPALAYAAGPVAAAETAEGPALTIVAGVLVLVMIAGLVLRAAGSAPHAGGRDGGRILACAAAAMLAFGLFGYGLMTPQDWIISAPVAGSGGAPDGILGAPSPGGYGTPAGSALFFHLGLVGFGAAAVAMAARVRELPGLLFAAGLGGLILPVAGSWTWGGGVLAAAGFRDLAGATLVCSVAGWCALTGLVVRGRTSARAPRHERAGGQALVLAGTAALWAGWSGSLAGAVSINGDPDGLTAALANGTLAGAAGILAGHLAGLLGGIATGGRGIGLSGPAGLLAGLMAISADPVFPAPAEAALIGAVAVPVAALAGALLRRIGVVDPSGLVGVLLGAGICGTLAAAGTDPAATLAGQIRGIAVTGGFAALASTALWVILDGLLGLSEASPDASAPGSAPVALPGAD